MTPWSSMIIKELVVFQLIKKFSSHYGNRRFIAVFVAARHWTVS